MQMQRLPNSGRRWCIIFRKKHAALSFFLSVQTRDDTPILYTDLLDTNSFLLSRYSFPFFSFPLGEVSETISTRDKKFSLWKLIATKIHSIIIIIGRNIQTGICPDTFKSFQKGEERKFPGHARGQRICDDKRRYDNFRIKERKKRIRRGSSNLDECHEVATKEHHDRRADQEGREGKGGESVRSLETAPGHKSRTKLSPGPGVDATLKPVKWLLTSLPRHPSPVNMQEPRQPFSNTHP